MIQSILSACPIPCSTDTLHSSTPGITVFPLHTRPKQRLSNVKLLYRLSKPVQLISGWLKLKPDPDIKFHDVFAIH